MRPELKRVEITAHQLPNGYWSGRLVLNIGGLRQEFSEDLFHSADEALEWARCQYVFMSGATV